MQRAEFMQRFGSVYEHSPHFAERVWDAGLGPNDFTASTLAERFAQVLDQADAGQQLALLRAHPQLAVGRAQQQGLSADSRDEQRGAGLDACSDTEFAEFSELNKRYLDQFGFPFILAVAGLEREVILQTLRERVEGQRVSEFDTALNQVKRIARLRLEAELSSEEKSV